MPALRTLQNRLEKSTPVLQSKRSIGKIQWFVWNFIPSSFHWNRTMECRKLYELFRVACLPSIKWNKIHLGSGGRLNPTPTTSVHFNWPRWPPVTVGARPQQSYGRIRYCEQSKRSIGSRSSLVVICTGIRSGTCVVKPCFMDTHLIRKPRYYGQFSWCTIYQVNSKSRVTSQKTQ